jgi:hypothetical protein
LKNNKQQPVASSAIRRKATELSIHSTRIESSTSPNGDKDDFHKASKGIPKRPRCLLQLSLARQQEQIEEDSPKRSPPQAFLLFDAPTRSFLKR